MNKYEFESVKKMGEHLESARIYAGSMFENHCNNGNYDKAVIFQGLRDRLDVEIQTIESYMYCQTRKVKKNENNN